MLAVSSTSAGHPPVDFSRARSTLRAAANTASSSSSRSNSSSVTRASWPAVARRAVDTGTASRDDSRTWPLAGRSTMRRSSTAAPPDSAGTSWTSSNTRHTPAARDHTCSSTASTSAHGGSPSALARPAMRCSASASVGAQDSQTSRAQVALAASAMAATSSTVLPNPGPATTVRRRVSQRRARRLEQSRPLQGSRWIRRRLEPERSCDQTPDSSSG